MNNPTEPLDFPDAPKGGAEDAGPRLPVRVGTLVWGAVVVVIGLLVLATRQAGLQLDTGQATMWLLFGAGLAMVAGGAVNVLRRK